jgi:hypothetical protein
VESSCEKGNEPSGSMKCLEVLEYLRDWRLLKVGSMKLVSLFLWILAWLSLGT